MTKTCALLTQPTRQMEIDSKNLRVGDRVIRHKQRGDIRKMAKIKNTKDHLEGTNNKTTKEERQ